MSVNERLSSMEAGQARIEQKLDDLVNLQAAQHVEQRAYCERHNNWVATIQKDVDDLKNLRWYFRGVAALLTAIFFYFKEEIKNKLRGP